MSHNSHILIQQMSFNLVNNQTVFNRLNLTFFKRKTGLIGRNGIGKTTLLRLILGELKPTDGSIQIKGQLAYVPQTLHSTQSISVAKFLGVEDKIHALNKIYQGSIDENDYIILSEDWNIEARAKKQLAHFDLHMPLHFPLQKLSGGELTRLSLVKAFLSNADFLLLDEPTNHLDISARKQLFLALKEWSNGVVVISHDRTLLNLMEEIVELNALGLTCYGGNYESFLIQKEVEQAAHERELQDAKKQLQKTLISIQTSREVHEQKRSKGRALRKRGSIDKLTANSKKGRSERTQSKLLIKEKRLRTQTQTQLQTAKNKLEIIEKIDIALPLTNVPPHKLLLDIENISFTYPQMSQAIINNFSLKLQGPERIAFLGNNGSGKTTLIKLILGELQASHGNIRLGTQQLRYLDQTASLLNAEKSILENFIHLNPDIHQQEAHQHLAQFLFKNVCALKQVKTLSGGEKLRAHLACVLMSAQPPQLLILDEPTNYLDLQSIYAIESALSRYQGAMIVVSHDESFLKNIRVSKHYEAPYK